MRGRGLLLLALALTACGDRRTFEERYKDTSSELEQRARAIDQNIANDLPADEAPTNSST